VTQSGGGMLTKLLSGSLCVDKC